MMKKILLSVFVSFTIPGFSQMLVFSGENMILKPPFIDNAIIEVSDTVLRKIVYIKHEDPTWAVQVFKFGYNNDGLFQTKLVRGDVLPVNDLKKALDTKSNRIYFNDLDVRQQYKTFRFSFVIKVAYAPKPIYNYSLSMMVKDSTTLLMRVDSADEGNPMEISAEQWGRLTSLQCQQGNYEILEFDFGFLSGENYTAEPVQGAQFPVQFRDQIIEAKAEKVYMANMKIKCPDGSVQRKTFSFLIKYP